MEIISVTPENLAEEHICCAISDRKGETCVASKKAWLAGRFGDGLVFKKLNVRGKAFIEYIPAEKAWCPVEADGYMHIDCFWVSGQFQGQGHANRLLAECIADAKAAGKQGLSVLSSKKKMPFLSDPQYLKYKGFQVGDTVDPGYELLYLPFGKGASVPKFKSCARQGRIDEKGMVLYYASQCPHTDKYAPLVRELAGRRGAAVKLVKLETTEQARNVPGPFTAYGFFFDGKFVTHEILGEKKFEKFMDDNGL